MNQYCAKCGNMLTSGNRYCSFCGTQQQPTATAEHTPPQPQLLQQQAVNIPAKPKKSVLGIVTIITAAVVVAVCTASYFLFFAGKPSERQASVSNMPAKTAGAANTEPAQKPAAEVDYAATRDVADLVGVWAGELGYTEISGDWGTFTYPVSQGYIQPFMLKITEGGPELNWRQAILRIDGGDAAVLNAGFEGRFLEIRGNRATCPYR